MAEVGYNARNHFQGGLDRGFNNALVRRAHHAIQESPRRRAQERDDRQAVVFVGQVQVAQAVVFGGQLRLAQPRGLERESLAQREIELVALR